MKAFWPRPYFTYEAGAGAVGEETANKVWWVGERVREGQSTYVGLLCSKKSHTEACTEKHGLPAYDGKVHPEGGCVVSALSVLYDVRVVSLVGHLLVMNRWMAHVLFCL